jgi:hypothetical protein
MMKIKAFVLVTLVLMLCSACSLQTIQKSPFGSGNQAWIDAPLPGSHLPLAPVEIVAHATNPGGVASFQINLNGQPLGTANPDPASIDQSLVYMRYNWQPAAPGTYIIEVQAMDNSGLPGAPVQVTVTVGEPTPTIEATITPVVTSSPTPVPTAISTPTPAPLTFTPGMNAYCRKGPGAVFAPLDDAAMKGTPYPIDGKNRDGTWFRIMLTPNEGCWVPVGVGTLSGDVSGLRTLADVPTPTAITSCSAFTDKTSCQAQSACQWKFTISGPAICVSK